MIRLKNVSKFYYSKGVIASGFSKINLSFDIGEFVAITGESGSGKSTLLNVISGLDTYEEGEMYINGEETSHYTEKDFEKYRRKYIGNIFQNFNLVGSYTVYQNIELVLLLNGNKRKNVKKKVLDLINKVGLSKFKNTKVSKLSGGQKQRVAIARALAKDTPIIIADEPTGNLDSKSAEEIMALLSEISKDKLVIVVTHNYEQIEKYVTRKITMHDGKILEDKKIKDYKKIEKVENNNYKDITLANKFRLGFRNTFNIIPKFLLLFLVYMFIIVSLISEYSSFKKQEYMSSINGYNYYFQNTSDKRIVIKKKDKTPFTEEDYKKIEELDNIDYVIENDLLLDTYINITDDENFWIYGSLTPIKLLDGSLDIGRMPENESEIVLVGNEDDYYLGNMADKLIGQTLYLENYYTDNIDKSISLKVVGIKYDNTNYNTYIYADNLILDKINFQINQYYSDITINFEGMNYISTIYNSEFKITPTDKVNVGEAFISNDYSSYCKNENCINHSIKINLNNLYYSESKELVITKTYNKNNFKRLLELDSFDSYNGTVFISNEDYNNLFNKATYQSSIFIKDVNLKSETISSLENLGYKTLVISDTLVQEGNTEIIKIISLIVTIGLVITLFFISYFVIRIILKSRQVYFTTIRMLGATKKISKQLLLIELNLVANIAYFIFIAFLIYQSKTSVSFDFINTILDYLKISDYIVLYLILMIMSILISIKFSKKLFKNSAMSSLKEEV
jgi:ABC-type lipoprotein export system ATPase subunit